MRYLWCEHIRGEGGLFHSIYVSISLLVARHLFHSLNIVPIDLRGGGAVDVVNVVGLLLTAPDTMLLLHPL
jgi:hypothetical protein